MINIPLPYGRGIQKSIFLKSGQLITGLSKAWIGTNTKLLELPTSQDEESYQYTLLATKTFTLSGKAQASEGIEDIRSAALLPSLTTDEYMSLKQLKIEITHTDFEYSAYSQYDSSGGNAWLVQLCYRYGYNVSSSGTSTLYISIPIFQHRVVFSSDTMTKSVLSTNFGKAYASPHYPSGYKTMTDSFSDYNRNINEVTNYGNYYTNVVFFNNLTYPFMAYQYCDEGITLVADSGSWQSYYAERTSRLSLPNSVDITVKIYGAY